MLSKCHYLYKCKPIYQPRTPVKYYGGLPPSPYPFLLYIYRLGFVLPACPMRLMMATCRRPAGHPPPPKAVTPPPQADGGGGQSGRAGKPTRGRPLGRHVAILNRPNAPHPPQRDYCRKADEFNTNLLIVTKLLYICRRIR